MSIPYGLSKAMTSSYHMSLPLWLIDQYACTSDVFSNRFGSRKTILCECSHESGGLHLIIVEFSMSAD